MNFKDEEINSLWKRYQDGQSTENENAMIEDWYMQFNDDSLELSEKELKQIKSEVASKIPNILPTKKVNIWPQIAAIAVVIVIIIFVAVYFSKI